MDTVWLVRCDSCRIYHDRATRALGVTLHDEIDSGEKEQPFTMACQETRNGRAF